MTMITPVGGKGLLNWVPSESKLTKTASEGEQPQERDELLEAAKSHLDEVKEASESKGCSGEDCDKDASCDDCGCCKACCKCDKKETKEAGCDVCGDEMAIVEIDGPADFGGDSAIESDEVIEEVSDDGFGAVEEVEEGASEDSAVKEVQEAVEKIKEAAEQIEEAVLNISDVQIEEEPEMEEVSIEIEDDVDELDALEDAEGAEEVPGVIEDDEEEVDVEKEGCTASSEEQFMKLAMISPSNRKKLVDYWTNVLNYPADYVKLMVKDYEK